MPTMKDLGIDRLSLDDRVVLAHEILDSIAAEQRAMPISDELRRELARRGAEDDADPNDVITLEQVRAGLRARARP